MMGRRRWSTAYKDLRGRWKDNKRLVHQLVADARQNRDWSRRIQRLLAEDSAKAAPLQSIYALPPDLRHATFDGMDLSNADFTGACLVGATAYGSQASRINCTNAIIHTSKWGKSVLTDARFNNVAGRKAYFGHSDLRNANFEDADLRYASFRDCDLQGANFSGADLRFARLDQSQCEGAIFSHAAIYGASLWDLKYNRVASEDLDLTPEADRSVTATNLKLAPLVYFISHNRHFAEVISILKLKTIVILGKDNTDASYERLKEIAAVVENCGMIPIIVRQQQEILGEPFLKKALLYCNLARSVIVENSAPAGQIIELPIALFQGSVTAILQEQGKGSTWLLEELLVRQRNAERFIYTQDDLEAATLKAIEWSEKTWTRFAEAYEKLYGSLELTYFDFEKSNQRTQPCKSSRRKKPRG